jgi:hypothetical protein
VLRIGGNLRRARLVPAEMVCRERHENVAPVGWSFSGGDDVPFALYEMVP